jgi:restriction system protein
MKKDGTKYELHVARKMRFHGYVFVKHSGRSGDFGADIIARTLFLRKIVVQCKSYSHKVGVRAVQEVIAARQYYGASRAAVATNSTFTRSAQKLAKACKVELWEKY